LLSANREPWSIIMIPVTTFRDCTR